MILINPINERSSYKEAVNAINRLPLQNDHAIRIVIL